MNNKASEIGKQIGGWLWRKYSTVIVVALVIAAFIAGFTLRSGPDASYSDSPTTQPAAHDHDATDQTQVWTCSMHPQIRQPKPGKCPICGMNLIPANDSGSQSMAGMRQMTVTPEAAKLMEIETSPVERRYVEATIRMVGKVEYDETRLGYITAWVGGRLDRLFVDYTGVAVKQGDHMVQLYSPELLSAQEELIQAIRAVKELEKSGVGIVRETAAGTVVASREKLRLWGLTPQQIKQIEERGTPSDHVIIQSPMGGIVIHKNAQEGMYVQTGTRIYTIADLTHLWVRLDAYESDLAWLRYGQPVRFTTEAYPGQEFTGTVAFIDPVLDDKRRTVKVRVNVSNDDGRLKPGMFIRGTVRAQVASGGRVMDAALAGKWISPMHPEIIKDEPGPCDICGMPLVRIEELGYVSTQEEESAKPLVVPASAVLATGTRAIVYVKVSGADKPTFEGREIVLGARTGDYYIVRSNLQEGDEVVTQGNFKIDSALQLSAKPSMMNPEGGGGGGGHQHGGSAKAVKNKDKASTMPAVVVPEAFRAQWRKVETTYRALSDAMKSQPLEVIQSHYLAVAEALKDIDMHQLTGDTHGRWMELSMRMANDAVEGEQAINLKVTKRAFRDLTKNIQQVRMHLGLHEAHASAPGIQVPVVFSNQLGTLIEAYFEIASSLSDDDFTGAQSGVANVQLALNELDPTQLDEQPRGLWTQSEASLKKSVKGISDAQDIDAFREGFALLSEELSVVTRTMAPRVGPVYRVKCPMAFGGRGAMWLQNNMTVANPYFGSMMPRCGLVVETLSGQEGPSHEGHDHE
jgi:Cu(I)/Ag(I) efflux system membrane fusion protein